MAGSRIGGIVNYLSFGSVFGIVCGTLSADSHVTAATWPVSHHHLSNQNGPKQVQTKIIDPSRTDGVPAEFDCAMRKAAYKFGKQLVPRHGPFMDLYYALDLNSDDCHYDIDDGLVEFLNVNVIEKSDTAKVQTRPSQSSEQLNLEDHRRDRRLPHEDTKNEDYSVDYVLTIHVDPYHGNDNADNASTTSLNEKHQSSPFKSIQVAADYAAEVLIEAKRTMQDNDKDMQSSSKKFRAAIRLHGGTHYLDQTLSLTSRHSGIHFSRADPMEKVILSGGIKLDNSKLQWTKYQPNHLRYGTHLRNYIDDSNIWVADLSLQPDMVRNSIALNGVPGLQINGQRATRARYPNLPHGIEVSCGYGCMIPGDQVKWNPPILDDSYYYNDKTQLHNRSNGGWFETYMIGINGSCAVYDPPVSYWCSKNPSGGGAVRFKTPAGLILPMGDDILPNSKYYNLTKLTQDAVFFVWRPARWANWMFQVQSINETSFHDGSGKGVGGLMNITFGHGGFQGARGEASGGDWFIENLLEELDHPNEFYYDSESQKLYLYYNATTIQNEPMPPPIHTEFVVPQRRTIVNISGTQWDPIWDVHITGFTFTSSRYTYMDPHGVPSAGDWALERNGAIFLQGTHNTIIRNCEFDRLDGNGIMISGFNRNLQVLHSDFSYIGGTAIASWGYTNETQSDPGRPGVVNENWPYAGIDGTDGEHPRRTSVIGCTIREVGLYEKQSSFFMQAKTAETKLLGNVFFNGPRAGINLNDGFGGGDQIAYNLVFSTCRESGDHGPFNSWDRQPFYTHGRRNDTVQPSMIMDWREIHHNFFIDNYSPQEGVDNDDGSAYYHTHDNFLVYGRWGMKNDFGGHSNHHYNNIYAYIQQVFNVSPQLRGKEDYFFNNRVIMRDTKLGYFGCKEGPDGSSPMVIHDNSYYTPTGELEECGMPLADWQSQGHDAGSHVGLHPDHDTIIAWASEMLKILG